jgi:hypothetical protein
MSQVRLVCTLLLTCGGYFHRGSAARKLDRFLAFFQRYILAKPPLPLDIDFDVQVPGSLPSCTTEGPTSWILMQATPFAPTA